MASVTLLVFAILGTLSATLSVGNLERETEAHDRRTRALIGAIERIRGLDPAVALDEFRKKRNDTDDGETVTVTFPSEMLVRVLPKLDGTSTCFVDLDHDGQIDFDASKPPGMGLLPIEVVTGEGATRTVVQVLVAIR